MLLETYMREWEQQNGIQCGYGRGSVSGSMIAYILGITQMDSMKFNLNFFRFMNPSRVTNADIDTDYSGKDRDKVKEFLLRDRMNLPQIQTSEIITFNTIALKGAIRDVGRALNIPLADVSIICNQCIREGTEDIAPDDLRAQYPELFRYVDIVNGTIVSIGTHPSGVLVSDLNIAETIGLCSISTSDYPVSIQYHSETNNGEVRGQKVTDPIMTLDTSNRYALITPSIQPIEKKAAENHRAVYAYLVKYYGQIEASSVDKPLNTLTTKDRFALVTVQEENYVIEDIYMRFLTPREMFNATGFPKDYIIDHDCDGKKYSRAKQVARCGNAVTPPVATALVSANLPEYCKEGEE